MEKLELTQMVYSGSGTLEISIFENGVLLFTVSKYRDVYLCCDDSTNYKFEIDPDLVENSKTLSICDWQLLKIIHHQVKSFQWEIFQILKDLVDNRVEEEYALERIKSILQKENKIES